MIIIILFLITTCQVESKIEINSGIYIERLPNISFYQTTRPVLFKFKKPVGIIEKLNCSTTFCRSNANLCKFLDTFKNSFDQISPNLEAGRIDQADQILLDDGEIFDFQFATRNHVKRMFTNNYEISILLQRIEERGKYVDFYEGDHPNFVDINQLNLTCLDINFNELVMLDFNLRIEWIRAFVTMCQTKRLQLNVISMKRLAFALDKIKNDNLYLDYVIALTSLSQYYTMPLIECILSPDTGLVGIHIPLIRRHLQGLQMKKILTPTFAWENNTCTVNIPSFTAALVENASHWEVLLPQCDPYREELCFVTEVYSTETLAVSCVRQVLNGGTIKQFASICPVTCRETGTTNQFLVPVGSHKVLVTHPKANLQLKCPLESHAVNTSGTIGTLLITVPCKCYFYDEDGEEQYPRYPCVDNTVTFETRKVIPAVWIKYDGLTLPPYEKILPQFEQLEDCLNGNWIEEQQQVHSSIPTLTYISPFNLTLIIIMIAVTTFLYLSILKKFKNYIPYKQNPPSQRDDFRINSPMEFALKLHQRRLANRNLPETPKQMETEDYMEPNLPRYETAGPSKQKEEWNQQQPIKKPAPLPEEAKQPLYVNMEQRKISE